MAKAAVKVKEPVPPKTIDDLLSIIRILVAHKIYFTLANPTHSTMHLHIIKSDLPRAQELLPDLFPNIKGAFYGKDVAFSLSGAPDKVAL